MLNIEKMFVQKASERAEKRIRNFSERTIKSERKNDV